MPCQIVDEVNDASPENLTNTVIQLTGSGKKYILTADAGVDSFDYMEGESFDNNNIEMLQLPHHGSRRNINSSWIEKFKPNAFFVSAEGNAKHPRRAVINCIKRNLPGSKVYSTHTHEVCLSFTTADGIFPSRGWVTAVPFIIAVQWYSTIANLNSVFHRVPTLRPCRDHRRPEALMPFGNIRFRRRRRLSDHE